MGKNIETGCSFQAQTPIMLYVAPSLFIRLAISLVTRQKVAPSMNVVAPPIVTEPTKIGKRDDHHVAPSIAGRSYGMLLPPPSWSPSLDVVKGEQLHCAPS
jgi:hypothetical protein